MNNGEIFRAYSLEYGSLIGICWGALLLSYTYGIRTFDTFLILLSFILFSVCLLLPFLLGARLNSKAYRAGIKVSYWQGLLISLSMFFYASLMGTLITFSYFEYLDHGAFMEAFLNMLNDANMGDIYSQIGMSNEYEQMVSMLKDADKSSSLEKALLMFNNDITWGFCVSFLVAITISWKRRG